MGGPIKRDRLWFFASARNWGFTENVPGVYWLQSNPTVMPANAEQATDPTTLKSYDGRVTTQLGQTRLTGSYSYGPRWRQHFGIENRGGTPESFAQYPNKASVTQVKMTSTLTSHLLFEAGFSRIWWWALLEAQERTRLATCFVAFAQCPAGTDYGDIRKRDLTLGWNYNAPSAFGAEYASPRNSYMSSLSYVSGAHNMKVGFMWDTGYRTITTPMNNGGLQQQYRLGVPDSVVLQTLPSVTGHEHRSGNQHLHPGCLDAGTHDAQPGPALRAHQGLDTGSDGSRRPIPAAARLHAGRLRAGAELLGLQPALRRRLRSLRQRKDGAEGQLREVRAVVLVEPRRRLQPDGRWDATRARGGT